MLRLIPWPYRIGIAAAVIGILCVSSYVAGRKAVRGQLDALRQGYEVAAAQAAGARKERERADQARLTEAQEKLSHANKRVAVERDTASRSLREHGESARLRIAASPTARDCPVSGPGFEDLLRKGEELEELVSAGARLSNSLAACLAAWPK
jgi:hypothetical protein